MTELAEQDLENIGGYIAYTLLNPQAAAATVSGIRSKSNALCDFPERNELSRDMVLAQIGVRIEHYRNYNIH